MTLILQQPLRQKARERAFRSFFRLLYGSMEDYEEESITERFLYGN